MAKRKAKETVENPYRALTSQKIVEQAKKVTDERFVQLEFDSPILFAGIIVDTKTGNVGFLAPSTESGVLSVKVVDVVSSDLFESEGKYEGKTSCI